MSFKTADVAGLRVFYREAGDPSKPTIVLLHGFPSSSYQFHDLIPRLADRFHVIAPDYPGMGFSDAPPPAVLRPTFDDVAMAIDAFIAQRAPGPLILYLHDIGGPIGMRIATAHHERIAGLIFQNFTISAGGPLKPCFGLSGAVSLQHRVSPLPVRVFSQSTRIQSPRVLHTRPRSGENYSTPTLQGVQTGRASPDCDEYSEVSPRTADDSGY
jgi:pimeloyl-ACP methyl ester carboxylesterase